MAPYAQDEKVWKEDGIIDIEEWPVWRLGVNHRL